MKKIRSIRQLKMEKKRIRQEQDELENKIRSNWGDLKNNLRPATIAKDTLSSFIHNKTEQKQQEDGILKSAFTYGLTLLAKKFADKAGNRLNKIFKK